MPDIKHSIRIDAPVAELLSLVSTPEGLARWWAEDVETGDDGAVAELGFFDRATVYRLRRETASESGATWRCETGSEWGGTRLEFELQPAGDGAELLFSHRGWAAETPYFVSCNTTWGELMFRLKATAEGKEPGPLFPTSGLAY